MNEFIKLIVTANSTFPQVQIFIILQQIKRKGEYTHTNCFLARLQNCVERLSASSCLSVRTQATSRLSL